MTGDDDGSKSLSGQEGEWTEDHRRHRRYSSQVEVFKFLILSVIYELGHCLKDTSS